MISDKSKPPNPIIVALLFTLIGASIVIGSWAGIIAIKHANDESNGNKNSITAVQKAASKALTVAESQRRTILAVCVRFASDEAIAESQTRKLMTVEADFSGPDASVAERRYHLARMKVLKNTDDERKAKIKVDCNKAMQSHIDSATPVPFSE